MKYYLTAIPLSWAARGWLRTVSGSCVVRLRFSILDLATLCHRELQGGGGGACLAPAFLSMSMWIESHLVGPGDTRSLSSSLQHPWEKAGHNGVSVTPGMEGGRGRLPGIHWSSSLADSTSTNFHWKKKSLKNQDGDWWKKILHAFLAFTCMCVRSTCTCVLMNMNIQHTRVHTHSACSGLNTLAQKSTIIDF